MTGSTASSIIIITRGEAECAVKNNFEPRALTRSGLKSDTAQWIFYCNKKSRSMPPARKKASVTRRALFSQPPCSYSNAPRGYFATSQVAHFSPFRCDLSLIF